MKKNLGWPLEPTFYIPDEVYALFNERRKQLETNYNQWCEMLERYSREYPEEAQLWSEHVGTQSAGRHYRQSCWRLSRVQIKTKLRATPAGK